MPVSGGDGLAAMARLDKLRITKDGASAMRIEVFDDKAMVFGGWGGRAIYEGELSDCAKTLTHIR